jgi:steroid 5-alpha reductase family enzyme
MKTVHYVQLVLMALVAAAASVAQQDPTLARYALDVVAALTPVLGVLGVVSKAAGDNSASAPKVVPSTTPSEPSK